MAHSARGDDASTVTEPKFYLPAGSAFSGLADRLDQIWSDTFNHGV